MGCVTLASKLLLKTVFDYPERIFDITSTEAFCFKYRKFQMARALDGRQHIDFRFSIDALSDPINAVGFEKYQKDMRSWFVSDLENGVMLEVVEVEQPLFPTVEIHVFSLA